MFGFVKKLFQRETPPDLDPVALVMLLTEPRVLSRSHVAHAVGQAIEAPFGEGQVVEEAFSYHRLIVLGYELTIGSRPQPYIPKDRPPTGDWRMDGVIQKHEAAILIDCWDAPPGQTREDSTDLMGRIVAALNDDTTLAVFAFHTQRLNVMDEKLLGMLTEGRGREAMETNTSDAIVGIHNEDALMNAAIDEARSRWPEFVAHFARRGSDDGFLVKARFGDGDGAEHMWLTVDAADEEGVAGILQSQPFVLPRPRQGDAVRVERERVSDWIASVNGTAHGNFSDAAIRAAREAIS
ncbi:DUF2314 domain-containing protein [bacterium]|nr:MAG: DUF2314 domain-containing protein [bacterium]